MTKTKQRSSHVPLEVFVLDSRGDWTLATVYTPESVAKKKSQDKFHKWSRTTEGKERLSEVLAEHPNYVALHVESFNYTRPAKGTRFLPRGSKVSVLPKAAVPKVFNSTNSEVPLPGGVTLCDVIVGRKSTATVDVRFSSYEVTCDVNGLRYEGMET